MWIHTYEESKEAKEQEAAKQLKWKKNKIREKTKYKWVWMWVRMRMMVWYGWADQSFILFSHTKTHCTHFAGNIIRKTYKNSLKQRKQGVWAGMI